MWSCQYVRNASSAPETHLAMKYTNSVFSGLLVRIVKLLLHCSIVYSDVSIARSVIGNVDHIDADPCFGRTGTTVGARLA